MGTRRRFSGSGAGGSSNTVNGATQTALDAKMAALNPTAVKTSAYTATANDLVPVDTTSGAVTITLPTAPADKSLILVKHIIQGGTNTVTIALGGSDVFNKSGGATTGSLPMVNQAMFLQYKSSGAIWYVIADDLSLSALDARYTGKTTYDANSILKADTDDTPVALTMGASTLLARLASGGIVAATVAEIKSLLGIGSVSDAAVLSKAGGYEPVHAVAVANVSVSAYSGTTMDSQALTSGTSRVLLTAQTTTHENGIWIYNGSGSALTRPSDYAAGSVQTGGKLIEVMLGSTYAGTIWRSGSSTITVGTDGVTWAHIAYLRTGGGTSQTVGTTVTFTGNVTLPSNTSAPVIRDGSLNESLRIATTGSAVNDLTSRNAATGTDPALEASGDDTNVGLLLKGKGTGRVRIGSAADTPASATATGTAGSVCWDSGFIYVCVATNTWVRAALSTW